MKFCYPLFIALLVHTLSAQNLDLPRYSTPWETQQAHLRGPGTPLEIGFTNPPAKPVRAMAEWEELQALVIAWKGESTILSEIVRAGRLECKVIICCDSQQTIDAAKTTLTGKGIDLSSNVEFVIIPTDSIWIRDYGPNSVYANDVDSLYLIDWIYNRARYLDDALPVKIGKHLDIPVYSTSTAPYDLVNTGGNFMSDGAGTAFASKLIFINNDQLKNGECGNSSDVFGSSNHNEASIDGIMQQFMGISRYIKMDGLPYDCIHHIDMHMKLLDEETLLVGQYPDGVADGPQIEANLQYVLSNFKSVFGTPYKVIRILMPPQNNLYPDNGGAYRTFANAVFVNKTVIVPFYQTKYDTTARRIWQEALPGYKIVGINCNSIIPSLGAIHCITREIGVDDPLRIVHQALGCQDNTIASSGYSVTATAQHRSGITGMKLYYTTDPGGSWKSTQMTQGIVVGPWFGSIPPQPAGSTVYYYLEATAGNGKSLARPLPAPQGYWKFCVTETSGSDELPSAELRDIYPNPASAMTVIPVNTTAKTSGSIRLYNALGQQVKTVFAGDFPAGQSNYFVDASVLASGAYFVELQTSGQVTLKKWVVR